MISAATIDAIKAAVPTYQLVSEYVRLRKSGGDYLGCCPFHNEKTPSFRVHVSGERAGLCKCFGCGFAGNQIDFLREIEQLTFLQAIRKLSERSGIPLDQEKPAQAVPAKTRMRRIADQEDEECCEWWWKTQTQHIVGQLNLAASDAEWFPVSISWSDAGEQEFEALAPMPESYAWAVCVGRIFQWCEGRLGVRDGGGVELDKVERMRMFKAMVSAGDRREFRKERAELRMVDALIMEALVGGQA